MYVVIYYELEIAILNQNQSRAKPQSRKEVQELFFLSVLAA
jgi:hypothetical protein|tara:strand:+ start:2185 stop:2307 length:123 start_codon:yes stop_codon:yes gene_type:complete